MIRKFFRTSGSVIKNISVEEAREQTKTKGIAFIDVRTPAEWSQTGLAPNALAISLQDGSMISKIYDAAGEDKSATIIVMCRSGARSAKACKLLSKAGFTDLINVKGGMLAWKAANLPTKAFKG